MPKTPTLYLVDSTSNIYRGHWTTGHLAMADGTPTGAVFGFANILLKLLREEAPTHVGLVFDARRGTFRNDIYPAYKANRTSPEPDMVRQIPLIYEMIEKFGIPTLRIEGWEADDVVATLVDKARAQGWDVVLVSGDKDFMQLVGPGVRMIDPIRGRRIGPEDVQELAGVPHDRIAELMALTGDAIDNIPGVKGVGPKWAADLVNQYGTVEEILAHVDEIKHKSVREALKTHADTARISRKLVEMHRDVPIEFDPAQFAYPADPALWGPRVRDFFKRLEMHTIVRTLDQSAPVQGIDRGAYRLVATPDELRAAAERARTTGRLSVELLATSDEAISAQLLGVAVAAAPGEAAYAPFAHGGLHATPQLAPADALAALAPLLADEAVAKDLPRAKFTLGVLEGHGLALRGLRGDPCLLGHLLDTTREGGELFHLARRELEHTALTTEDVCGRGRARARGLEEVTPTDVLPYAGEQVDLALRLVDRLWPQVERDGLAELYRTMELPLCAVLARMERRGILVDVAALAKLGADYQERMNRLQDEVWEIAGERFNPGSTPQLRQLLFDKLGLEPGRRTKTGFSTDQAVLEDLDHPIADKLLLLRKLTKLKNTYLDVLPKLVNPTTGRVHTTFNQTGAATGRLSSDNPNLQNIPVRDEEGRQIREAFHAAPGHVLLSADYSQIELRLLAHLSRDEALVRAFHSGEDIHRATAAEVLGIDPATITKEQRAAAKAVNFGIMYGISSFGLARNLGVSRDEAQKFIDRYRARYAGIQAWIERTLEEARESGEVRTIFGRRRRISNLRARQRPMREGAERQAVNTPIQGSAADILKAAMIKVDGALERELPAAKMLLTVHDELLFEVPAADAARAQEIVKREMEGVIATDPPLAVDAASAPNWLEAH